MDSCATRAIILRQTKYSESSIILKAFTEHSGVQSYILRGVRKKNKKTGMAVLQPMTLVSLVPVASPKSELKHVREIHPVAPYSSIPFDVTKSSVLIFLNEILNQVLKEESADETLFTFLFHSLEFFDQYDGPVANFHLLFLLQLTKYLGIYPRNNYSATHQWFDVGQGEFTRSKADYTYADETGKHLSILLKSDFEVLGALRIPHAVRTSVNALLLSYYKYHIPGFRDLKSLEVIQMILTEDD
ncbi:MAG: DNA repair protein RecO [Marinilabiliales bacterium]|nr:MAG: DNA repair protein RecO [Marinilabiliales bacterium]